MTVNVSKPAINVREKLAELDKPTGIAGEAMLRAETPQEQFNLIGAGRRNLIINGDFKVHQRGGTVVAGATDVYTLDRFINRGGSVSQSTDVPSGYGFKNSMFYDNDGTRTGINLRHKIEDGFTLFDGQDITISFWIKPSKACRIGVDIHDYYDTGFTIDLQANVWQYKTVTFHALDTGSFTDYWGGHMHFDMNFGNAYPDVYITGVQLEVGKVATPFEHRSYGEELALCQRYYYRHQRAVQSAYLGVGHCQSASTAELVYFHPVPMRATPEMDASATIRVKTADGTSSTNQNTTSITFDDPEQFCVSLGLTVTSGLVAGNAATVWLTGSSDYIEGDAEL